MLRTALCASEGAAMGEPVLFRGRLEDAFTRAKELGFDGVELHIRDVSQVDVQQLFRQREKTGMDVAAIGTGLAARVDGLSLVDANETGRRQAIERVKGCIDLAAEFGCCVIIGSLRGNIEELGGKEESIERLRYSMLELADYIGSRDCFLVFEVINRYENNYFNTVQETAAFVRELGMEQVKVHLDTFHMNIEESNGLRAIKEVGKELGHFHLADNTRWYPGQGQIDFLSILRCLEEVGYRGWMGMECLPRPSEKEAAARGIAYIRDLQKKL